MASQAPQRRGPPPTGHTSATQQQAQRSRQHQNRQRVAQVPPARQSRGSTQTAPRQASSSGPSNRVPPNMSEPPLLASQAASQSLPSPPLLNSGSVARSVIVFFELNKINFRLFQIFPIFRSHHLHIHLQIQQMLFKRLLRHQLILH